MIKECRVLSYNQFRNVIVFEYEGNPIQINAKINDVDKTIFVEYENKQYKIVSKNKMERQRSSRKKKPIMVEESSELTKVNDSIPVEADDIN